MNYGKIIERDSTNGPGIRVTLFVSGCTHHCKGCFQPETWNFDYGFKFTNDIENSIIDLLKPNYVSGLTILGGDPFEKSNQIELYPLIKKLREVYNNDKTIWAFTGAIYESLLDKEYEYNTSITKELLSMMDVLVDGPFMEEKKSLLLKFRGSSNQRLIDLKKSLKENKTILYE
jgi:anaerobic ribonucleoside-triphosphate reductase activating protein